MALSPFFLIPEGIPNNLARSVPTDKGLQHIETTAFHSATCRHSRQKPFFRKIPSTFPEKLFSDAALPL